MIAREEFPALLVASYPEFKTTCLKFITEWTEEAESERQNELPYYLLLGDFGEVVANLISSEKAKFNPSIFEMIEKFHVDGDGYVKEAATVGLLESVQGCMKHQQIKLDLAEQYLLPESLKWWRKLVRFWDDGDEAALRSDDE